MRIRLTRVPQIHLVVPADETVKVTDSEGITKDLHYKTKVILGPHPHMKVGDEGNVVHSVLFCKTMYYLVEFDHFIDGHDGNTGWIWLKDSQKAKDGWWLSQDEISIIHDDQSEIQNDQTVNNDNLLPADDLPF